MHLLHEASPVAPQPAAETSPTGRDWTKISRWVALIGVVVIAARIPFVQLLTFGDVAAIAMAPVWWSAVRRARPAIWLLSVGLLCIPVGLLLTEHSSADHVISRGLFFNAAALLLGLLATLGFLLWAQARAGRANTAIAYGVGLVFAIDPSSNLFSGNPWKFGYSVPVTVLALALLYRWGRRRLELVVLLVLAVACLFTDSRSALGILLLATAAHAWQLRPRAHNRSGSAGRVLLGASLAVVGIYYIAQALLLSGALGTATQARSEDQVERAGSLIVGGRPELLASIQLIADDPMGPGAGARPNHHEISVAKTAMASIQYDPNNGYVERSMFGNGYSLHSVVGDTWAQWGLVGLVFIGMVLALVLHRTAVLLAASAAPALLLYLVASLLWNFAFSPWYASLRLLGLTIALVLGQRPRTTTTQDDGPSAAAEGPSSGLATP